MQTRLIPIPAPDPVVVGGLSAKIGMESCRKCHLMHTPAALAQARFREWGSEGTSAAAP